MRKRNLNLWFLSIGFVCVFLLLAFVVFPFMKQIFVLPDYVPAQEIEVDGDFEAALYFNDSLTSHVFSDLLIRKIRGAKKSIRVAVYSIDSVEIRDELFAAAERGVTVDLILDHKKHDQHQLLFADAPSGFSIHELNVGAKTNSQYMHNKFVIFDENSLLTGAWNWTILQERLDPTYVMETFDSVVVDTYLQEYERLESGVNGRKKFVDESYKPFARKILYGDCFVEVWFSPGVSRNSVKQRILDLIDTAQEKIQIMLWDFTDEDIAKALRKKAESGVQVQIITDDFNIGLADSVFRKAKGVLKHENIEIISDKKREEKISKMYGSSNLNSFLHHHMMLVDGEVVLFGTNNWSYRGSFKNDENMIVTDNVGLVQAFSNSFRFNYLQLT